MKNGRVGAGGALRPAGKLRLQATSKRMLLFQRFHIKVRLSLAKIGVLMRALWLYKTRLPEIKKTAVRCQMSVQRTAVFRIRFFSQRFQ